MDLFNVTMGSFDGAETCQLVICLNFMLSLLQSELGNNIGLYCDDGLGVFNKPPREIENTKKEICRIFYEHGLRITIEANKTITHFLDVTLKLEPGIHEPYMKPNNSPRYINIHSNHPPNVLHIYS